MSIAEKYKKNIFYKTFNKSRLIYFRILSFIQIKIIQIKPFLKFFPFFIKNGPKKTFKKIKRFLEENKKNKIKYKDWFKKNSPTEIELLEQKEKSKKLKYKPKISIILPTYNTPINFLTECIDSVINQTYPHWELCIADDNSKKIEVIELIKNYLKKDNRIKCVFRKENGHICKSSNSALKITTGDFIGLLDHDDLLLPNALYETAILLNEDREIDFIYSDEDKLSEIEKKPTEPYLKNDWSIDKLFSFMYVGHFSVYKKEIIKKVNGFTIGTQGAQDYDLLLKSLKFIKNPKHLPQILYRWRKHPESTAMTLSAKPYAIIAGAKVLQKRLKDYVDSNFKIKDTTFGFYYISFKEIEKKSVDIFLNKNLLNSKTTKIIKENLDKKINNIIYFDSIENLNDLIKKNNGKYLLICNSNIFKIDSKKELINFIGYSNTKNVGFVGPKILTKNNLINGSGLVYYKDKFRIIFNKNTDSVGYSNNLTTQSNTTAITKDLFCIRRDVFEKEVKSFNEKLPNSYLIEACVNSKENNIRTVFFPQLKIFASKIRNLDLENKEIGSRIKMDFYLNPKIKINKYNQFLLK